MILSMFFTTTTRGKFYHSSQRAASASGRVQSCAIALEEATGSLARQVLQHGQKDLERQAAKESVHQVTVYIRDAKLVHCGRVAHPHGRDGREREKKYRYSQTGNAPGRGQRETTVGTLIATT